MTTARSNAITGVLRWLLVPISMLLTVAAAAAAGRWLVGLTEPGCAPDHLVGGVCVEPWHTTAVELITYTALAAAALGVTLVPGLIAPRGKSWVAAAGALLLVGGLLAAFALTRWRELLGPLLVGMLTGAAGVYAVDRWRRRHA